MKDMPKENVEPSSKKRSSQVKKTKSEYTIGRIALAFKSLPGIFLVNACNKIVHQ